MIKFYILICSAAFVGCELFAPRVRVEQGILEGKKSVTEDGQTYYSFLGVPYAKPPVGDLRFKAPEEPESWRGIRKATEFGKFCKAFDVNWNIKNITSSTDEDCLYVNIHTPNKPGVLNFKKLPVLVFIHGGGFQTGGFKLGPEWLVVEGIIFITFAYRTNAFGFLCLDTEEVPGNAGLKDQVEVLKWITQNIAAFGGDPDNVTIFGQSAGGASVNYHLVSDSSRELYQKAVLASGCSLNPWSHMRDDPVQHAFKLCEKLGNPVTTPAEALAYLRSLPANDILNVIGGQPPSCVGSDENLYLRDPIFLPVVEKTFPGKESFLSEDVRDRMVAGNFHKVPIMIGYTDAEGATILNDAVEDPVLYGEININFERYVPHELGLTDGSEKSLAVADKIKQFYYGNDSIYDNEVDSFVEVKSDTAFKRGINDMVKIISSSPQPIYYYRFAVYEPALADKFGSVPYVGASHYDDMLFLFSSKVLPRDKKDVELTRQRMVRIYSNFAKTGNPTPCTTDLLPVKWEPATETKLKYYSIKVDLELLENPDQRNMQFWENLVAE